jgi:hypothetical protein
MPMEKRASGLKSALWLLLGVGSLIGVWQLLGTLRIVPGARR